MLSKLAKALVVIVGAVILLLFVAHTSIEVDRLINLSNTGRIYSSVGELSDSTSVFVSIDSADFVSKPVPDSGDVVLTINNAPASQSTFYDSVYVPSTPPGRNVDLTVIHEDDTLTTSIVTRPRDTQQMSLLWLFSGTMVVLGLAFIVVAFWAFIAQPDSAAARLLALFCFAITTFTLTFHSVPSEYSTFDIPYLAGVMSSASILMLFFGAFWLHLHLLFPHPRTLVKRFPALPYLVCYAPVFLAMLLESVTGMGESVVFSLVLIAAITTQVGAGFYLLADVSFKTQDPLERRQTRLVYWGSGIALSALLVWVLTMTLATSWFNSLSPSWRLGISSAAFLLILASPLSFAYAFRQYNLLEIEGRIRRGTRFAAVLIGLLVVSFAVIYLASEVLLETLGIENRTTVLILALALAFVVAPAQGRARQWLEHRLLPERTRLKDMLSDFLQRALTTTDRQVFWSELVQRLKTALKVDQVNPVLMREEIDQLVTEDGHATAIQKDSKLVQEFVALGTKPLLIDEAMAAGMFEPTDAERKWIEDNGIALLLPLVTHSRTVGFLAIGSKTERKDFEPADIELLRSLGAQVAVAAENIELIEENFEKRRLEDQLSIARSVQEGLLPRSIPDTPGLTVAASCRFCLEVAGDYYDIVSPDEHHTVMAIGDVSGKGAGAALLMSNLQASFRTAATGGGSDLAEMVARINNLIHGNTPPDAFITFFVAEYDASKQKLIYVNAGHNPPILRRADGTTEELMAGGVMLGALPGLDYEQGEAALDHGDFIFMYTDGLSEAENPQGEMFGEDRIYSLVHASFERDPVDFLAAVNEKLKAFIKNTPLADDLTMLVAKIGATKTKPTN